MLDNAQMQAASVRYITGPTILLGSGAYLDYGAPEDCNLTIDDVAYGLAHTGRFQGQCVDQATGKRVFYSVAEHCVRMAAAVPPPHSYDALMHELGEVACGDMPSPLKRLCPEYREIEKRCEAAARIKFNVAMKAPDVIKRFDLIMLATERRDLMPGRDDWEMIGGALPLPGRITPWDSEAAARSFLAAYRIYKPKDQGL